MHGVQGWIGSFDIVFAAYCCDQRFYDRLMVSNNSSIGYPTDVKDLSAKSWRSVTL